MSKCSKIGRCKKSCGRYELEGRRIKNKIIKLVRHLSKHPDDKQSNRVLIAIKK